MPYAPESIFADMSMTNEHRAALNEAVAAGAVFGCLFIGRGGRE